MNTVIVGIGRSDNSKAALHFAVKEAAIRDAHLRIVRAWDIAPRADRIDGHVLIANDLEGLEQDAERTVALALELAARLEPNVQADGKAVFGEVVDILVDEAEAALKENGEVLLVVGSGARGTVGAYPTALHLLHRAPCPLTIVRATADKGRRRQRRSRETRVKDPAPPISGRPSTQSGDMEGERDYSMLSVSDVAALGKVDQAAVERCIHEDPRFPRPVSRPATGDLYDRTSIYKWAIEAGLKGLELTL